MVKQICYERHCQMGRMRLHAEMVDGGGEEVAIPTGKKPLVERTPQEKAEGAAAPVIPKQMPRIMKLMALAMRLEELLRQGIAKDYAELARLGGVSRSRITQILNLRKQAPVLQERILELAPHEGEGQKLTERALISDR
jgi:hypothetical protein